MKLWLDTDLVPIIIPDTYGSEFQYYVIDEQWDRLKQVMIDKAKEYITDALKDTESFSDAKIEMGEFHSPKEYNYRTDWIDFEIEFDDSVIEKYKDPDDDFDKFLKENYKSYDGYVNFMPENVGEFVTAINSKDATKFTRAIAQILVYELKKEFDFPDYQQDYLESVEDYAFGNGIMEYDEGGTTL